MRHASATPRVLPGAAVDHVPVVAVAAIRHARVDRRAADRHAASADRRVVALVGHRAGIATHPRPIAIATATVSSARNRSGVATTTATTTDTEPRRPPT